MDALAGNIKWTIRWPKGEQFVCQIADSFFRFPFPLRLVNFPPHRVTQQRFCTAILDFSGRLHDDDE